MNFRNLTFAAGFIGVSVLAGCGPADEPVVNSQRLALTAQQNTEQALRGLYDAGGFLADSASLAEMLGTLGSTESCSSTICSTSDPACVPGETCVTDEVTAEDMQQAREDVRAAIDDIVQTLRERVFTPANLESEDESSATYLLGPDLLCGEDDDSISEAGSSSPPSGAGVAVDAAPPVVVEEEETCEEQVARLQIRLRLSSPADGDVDVDLLLGPQQRNPVKIQLYDDRVGVVIDLGEAFLAAQDLGEMTDELAELVGRVGFEIVRNADLDYSFRVNVIEDVRVGAIDADGQRMDVSLGASTPTMELRLDGNLRQIVGTLGYGALRVAGPLEAFRGSFGEDSSDSAPDVSLPSDPAVPVVTPPPEPPPTPYEGNLEVLLGGVNGSVTYNGMQDQLNLTGLGLGNESTTIKHDGTTLLALDVNQAQGRRFDLGLQADGAGNTAMTFSPTLDVSLMVAFATLASQMPDLPAYLMGDTLRFWFDGDSPSLRTRGEQMEVVSGTLHMSSTTNPATNVDVPAGSCFADSGVDPVMSVLDSLSAGPCL